VPVGKPPF